MSNTASPSQSQSGGLAPNPTSTLESDLTTTHNTNSNANANAINSNELFPLDFLSFSNYEGASTSPGTSPLMLEKHSGGTPGSNSGMDFDFSQFAAMQSQSQSQSQSQPQLQAHEDPQSQGQGQGHGHGYASGGSRRGSIGSHRKRGSISSIGTGPGTRPTTSGHDVGSGENGGGGMDLDLKSGLSNLDLQMMLDAASATAGPGTSGTNHMNGESFDQASLQQQVRPFSYTIHISPGSTILLSPYPIGCSPTCYPEMEANESSWNISICNPRSSLVN